MKKIITALANPMLNNELKKQKDFIVIGNDIQYQDGVKEVLEKEKNNILNLERICYKQILFLYTRLLM